MKVVDFLEAFGEYTDMLKVCLFLTLISACLDESKSVPKCDDIGCPEAPSGSSERWEPCHTVLCYCQTPPVECEL